MKPAKKRKYCIACKRSKLLFETQDEADNFILDFKNKMKDKKVNAPVRSYYCRICGGYHLTSNPSVFLSIICDKRDEKIEAELEKIAKERDNPMSVLSLDEKIVRVARRLHEGRIDTAEMWLDECRTIITAVKNNDIERKKGWRRKEKRMDSLANMIEVIKSLGSEDSDKWKAYVEKENKTIDETEICQILSNITTLHKLEKLFFSIDVDIENEDFGSADKLEDCRELLKGFRGPFSNVITSRVKKRINGREEKIRTLSLIGKQKRKQKRNNFITIWGENFVHTLKSMIEKMKMCLKKYCCSEKTL